MATVVCRAFLLPPMVSWGLRASVRKQFFGAEGQLRWPLIHRESPGEPHSVQLSIYLINIRAGDPVPCVTIRAGATLETIPGVCTSDASEARVGVTPACCASWGCRRSDGHQCVWGWGLKAQRTWKTRPVQSIGLLIHAEYKGTKQNLASSRTPRPPPPSRSHGFLRRTTRSYSRVATLQILS